MNLRTCWNILLLVIFAVFAGHNGARCAPAKEAIQKASKQIHYTMEIPNPHGRLSEMTFVAGRTAYMKLFSNISSVDVTNFWNDLMVLKTRFKIKHIVMYLNSPGGSAFDGLGFADEVEAAQRDGFDIEVHATGIVASAALPILAVAKRRYATKGTLFMVHSARVFKWIASETIKDLQHQQKMLSLLRRMYISKLTTKGVLPAERWEKMMDETIWFDAQQAKRWGIIDEVE